MPGKCNRCQVAPRAKASRYCANCHRICSRCWLNQKAVRSNYCLDCKALYQREWRKDNPMSDEARLKDIARSMVGTYLRRGKISKGPCEVCGDPMTIARVVDYDNPLVGLRWLCRRHHRDDVNAMAKEARRRSP